MREIHDPIKDKMIEYSKKYPMYYDLVVYVMELEAKIKELEKQM
jgi:hypothetical protein